MAFEDFDVEDLCFLREAEGPGETGEEGEGGVGGGVGGREVVGGC